METLSFDLVTPQATFYSGPATLVEAPGTLGDFGVLPGHMPFVSTLRPGIVTVRDEKDQAQRLFVAGGIAEVNNTSCTILAEQVVDLGKYTQADAQARLTAAKAALDIAYDADARAVAEQEVAVAEALVAVFGVPHAH